MTQAAQSFRQTPLQDKAAAYFKDLQERICAAFEDLETEGATFECTPWTKSPEEQLKGGGEMRLMRGETFEKVGVNFSKVYGEFTGKFEKKSLVQPKMTAAFGRVAFRLWPT